MIARLFLVATLAAAPNAWPSGESADGVSYRDLSVEVEGELLDARLVQVEGDERPELVLVERSRDSGKREIHIYTYSDESGVLNATPWRSIPVFDDVIAFAVANVREASGKELLFFTRGGVFAMSPQTESMRGNIELLIKADLVYEVPAPDELPYWDFVIAASSASSLVSIVIPSSNTFSVWGPDGNGTGDYAELAEFSRVTDAPEAVESGKVVVRQQATVTVGGSSAGVSRSDSDASRVLLRSEASVGRYLLSFDRSYDAPGLADVNGDGATDLVVLSKKQAYVYLSTDGRIPSEPSRIEEIPEFLTSEAGIDVTNSIELIDFDRDGDADLFIRGEIEDSGQGALSNTIRLVFLRNDGNRLFSSKPDQLMQFEALELRAEIADVDADGVPDLVVRKFEAPSVTDVVSGLEFTHTTLLYAGRGKPAGRVFERRPFLKSERVYDENSVGGAIAVRSLSMDCSGDGIADLVEVDFQGRVHIQLLERETSFFSGDSWTLNRDSWKRFETRGEIGSLKVDDYNGDGLGDILSLRDDGVLLLFSNRAGDSR